jgi:hypothetical protein
MDRRLNFQHHYEVVMTKAKKAQGRVKGITGRLGLRPENAKKVQIAAVQSVVLYGSELWWDGQIGREHELQKLINESARRVTGLFRSTPTVLLFKEAGLRAAISLLNHRRRRFAKRLAEMPDQAERGALVEGESTLAVRLRKDLGIKGKRETNFLPINPQKAEARVYILGKKNALKVAQTTDKGLILWMDGSRLEHGRVWCAVVWKWGEEKWEGERHYLGQKKEVFDAEVYTIERGLQKAAEMLPTTGDSKVVIFSDSYTAIQQVQDDKLGP